MVHNKNKKNKKAPGGVARVTVPKELKELAKPRMSRSARIAERNHDTSRIVDHPRMTLPGTVAKIIPSPRPSQPETAQIAVDGPERRFSELRIENTLLDENGDDVSLKKGAHVEVTVTSEP